MVNLPCVVKFSLFECSKRVVDLHVFDGAQLIPVSYIMDTFWQTKDDPFSFMDPTAVFGELLFGSELIRTHCVSYIHVLPFVCLEL